MTEKHWLAAPATLRERWLLFLCFVYATVERMPDVVLRGRLWAEEGPVFYLHAATTHGLRAVFWSYAGYLNLGASLAAFAARHLVVPDFAPRVTLVFAALAQLSPAFLLVTSHARWLRHPLALAAALLLLVSAPSAEEVWLNTLHSQFFLALSAALILALEIGSARMEWFRRALLFLAPLYGLPAIMLLPLFILRAALERSRPRGYQALALAAGALIQLLLFYHMPSARQSHDYRLILGAIFAKNLLLPFLGYGGEAHSAAWLYHWLSHDVLPRRVPIALLAALAGIVVLLARGPREAWWLFFAFGIVCVLSWYGALLPQAAEVLPHIGGRYAFVPQILVEFTILAIAAAGTGWRRLVAIVLTTWLCGVSSLAYVQTAQVFKTGPDWRQEMAKWHQNPDYHPHLWPDDWMLPLPRPAS